jgi:hypothetical protein
LPQISTVTPELWGVNAGVKKNKQNLLHKAWEKHCSASVQENKVNDQA